MDQNCHSHSLSQRDTTIQTHALPGTATADKNRILKGQKETKPMMRLSTAQTPRACASGCTTGRASTFLPSTYVSARHGVPGWLDDIKPATSDRRQKVVLKPEMSSAIDLMCNLHPSPPQDLNSCSKKQERGKRAAVHKRSTGKKREVIQSDVWPGLANRQIHAIAGAMGTATTDLPAA